MTEKALILIFRNCINGLLHDDEFEPNGTVRPDAKEQMRQTFDFLQKELDWFRKQKGVEARQ